jgi:hypothetical protein
MKLGRNLARTFLDYYKLQNYIVFKPITIPKTVTDYTNLNNNNPLIKSRKLSQSSNKMNAQSSLSNADYSESKSNGFEPVFTLDDG